MFRKNVAKAEHLVDLSQVACDRRVCGSLLLSLLFACLFVGMCLMFDYCEYLLEACV